MTVWALHGFLGQPLDFQKVEGFCRQWNPALQWNSVDYMKVRELSPHNSLSSWGPAFNHYVPASSSSQILLGYSQGGRLALHALMNDPKKWSACILLSTNPGLPEHEKWARLQNDKHWAQRFLNEKFSQVVQSWNSQSVFHGSQADPERKPEHFNTTLLAECLTNWSVAQQINFSSFLQTTTVPILYLAGEFDLKYCQIGTSLSESHPLIEFERIPSASHRVMLDQPERVAERIQQFILKKSS